MRTAKFMLLAAPLALGLAGCGGGKSTPDAYTQMKKYKSVRILTDAVNPPFEFGSGTGVQGLDVDLGTEIAKDLGWEPKWVKAPLERMFDILNNGEAELIISAIPITPERKKLFTMSEPYYESGNTIVRRKEKFDIRGLSNLSGKKVGVQGGSGGDTFMSTQKTASGVTVVKFPTLDDALGALNRTEIDAVVGDEAIVTYSTYKSFPMLISTGARLNEYNFGVVTRKNEKELISKVNETIERLKKSGEIENFKNKWIQNVMQAVSEERAKAEREAELRESPKDVTFNLIKTAGRFSMERLDGFQMVLVGAKSYQSTPILTNGNRGNCRLSGVAPGVYRLNMQIFNLNTTVTIPKVATRSIVFEMDIGQGITITQR